MTILFCILKGAFCGFVSFVDTFQALIQYSDPIAAQTTKVVSILIVMNYMLGLSTMIIFYY